LYLTPTKSHWACDIEADDLLEGVTRIWCATLCNIVTKERVRCRTKDDFKAFQDKNPDAIYIGHNFIAYDAVVLNRFWEAGIGISRIVDTFVLSQVYNPSMQKPSGMPKPPPGEKAKGPHSLEAWGVRLRYPKWEHKDFSQYSPEMLNYCMRDTLLTGLLFHRLTERMRQNKFTERGLEIEHHAWNIIQNKQRRNGFPFNYKAATELYVSLRAREEELKDEIYKLWPPYLGVVQHYKRRRVKDGSDSNDYKRAKEQYPKLIDTVDGGFDAYDWITFDIGSPQQRVQKLLELGWEPTQRTDAGNPKVDEESLLAFSELSGQSEIAAIAKWLVVNSRGNMVRTWLDAYNEHTGCLHGRLFINSTLRYKHSSPNSANIPAVKTEKVNGEDEVLYGEAGTWAYECRDLYTCGEPNTWSLVGIDGKGIQLRVLANYAYSEEFRDAVLTGDPHKKNIEILGLANKPAAKKFLYTTLMGGGGAKLAADQAQFGTKLTAKEGNQLKQKLIDSVPGFGDLISRLQAELRESGRIKLCDGTPILVPSDHMVIPYLLQGDESRLMKQALIYVDREIKLNGLTPHVLKVADIHDEWQWKVKNEYVQTFIELALPCFLRAGESFNYRIPIEGAAKEGKTWAETH
jgi:DNA polymerase-1